jgi:DNA-binding GntR family transcriptional regulator
VSGAGADKVVLSQSIAAELEAEIVLGGIPGGTRLDEAGLARRFGVSRTPVREALQIVVSRALAVRLPYRGVVVTDVSAERIDQLFEAMGEIEALCGRFAAQRMSVEERAALAQMHADLGRLSRAGDVAGYEAANTRFHQMIYTGCHNGDLAEMAETMRLKLSPFRRSQLADLARLETSDAEHAGIVESIVQRDGPAAERALRRHLLSAAQSMLARWRAGRSVSPERPRASAAR